MKKNNQKTKKRTLGNLKHRKKEADKKLYCEFCRDGYTYNEIIELMKISLMTITRYALETNTIPSIKDFDRQQLYQLLTELNQAHLNYQNKIKQHQKRMAEKRKTIYDSDFWLK